VISAKRALSASRLRRATLTLALLALPAAALPAAAGAVTPGPAWTITSNSSPTNFAPGDNDFATYVLQISNTGSRPSDGSPITVTDILPPGFSVGSSSGVGFRAQFKGIDEGENLHPCEEGPPVRCTFTTTVHPGQRLLVYIPISVAPDAPPVVTNRVEVSGGGVAGASDVTQKTISSEPAPFAFQGFESTLYGDDGVTETRAGSHPYQLRVAARFNTHNPLGTDGISEPTEHPKTITADLPAGVVINPKASPVRCTEAQLETTKPNSQISNCPNASAVGLVHTTQGILGFAVPRATEILYSMVPPPGSPAAFAFQPAGLGFYVHLLGRVRSDSDYGLSADISDISQFGGFSGATVEFWGDPSDPSHDLQRGACGAEGNFTGTCPTEHVDTPLITMPSACSGPLITTLRADSWQHRGSFVSASARSEDAAGNPLGVTGCDKLSFDPTNESVMSTEQAGTGSGFDFNVDFPNNGWNNKNALAESTTKKAVVTLPEGVTINPSVGEGLGFCRPDQYEKETVDSVFGEGCPADSKLGTVRGETPLVDEAVDGSVFLAQQDDASTTTPGAENPFDTDIALYLVLKNPFLGVIIKRPVKIEPDPRTGQLVATLDDAPPLPISHFNFHFREGARAALITPPACGKYTTVAKFYPYSDPTNPRAVHSSFEIAKGVGGGPCPTGGIPPFNPRFEAGAVNNYAGAFSPFNMRLTRADGQQDMTKFSSILPPGELGSLAGVGKCPDAAIETAKSKTGRQELASPSCPANSLIGHTLAGAGVGDALTYVPGQVYLGGPYKGDPLSVIAVTPGLAGPFDAGTVVVRLALTLNSKTAEVEVDGANSDPIPHILKGIVLKVRDLRVYVDRPNFTLNPTSCAPSMVKATLFGSYVDVFSPADDVPTALSTRYQAADCQSLGYKPGLDLKLKGGTKRGGHPGLLATYKARPGDANTKGIVVRLPRSAFLDQAHIRTICTRVQFAEDSCPKGAQYGYIKAFTPLLDEPLEGPVWLRSSNHKLPDLVFDLHGLVDVEVSTRIDSARGGIRASIEDAPDAPLNKVVLRMQGGKKGLIVNSRNLCGAISRANAEFEGQNGKESKLNPVMKADCGGKRKHKRAVTRLALLE
jgi:uncharacterized repeat protein (TIGR01451 family)